MIKLSNPSRTSVIFSLLVAALLMTVSLCALAQKQGDAPRRPLPKPATGSRGFEQYGGKDSSSRLIAAGATRGGELTHPRKPIAPLEGLAFDAHPFFVWEAGIGLKSYHFTLYEGDVFADPAAKVVYEKDVADTELAYPKDAPALVPGKLYSWRVSTTSSGGKELGPAVTFFVLTGQDAAEVKQALEKSNLNAPKTVADKLKRAQVFEEYGIWYDALRTASEVAAANPSDLQAQGYYNALLEKLDRNVEP